MAPHVRPHRRPPPLTPSQRSVCWDMAELQRHPSSACRGNLLNFRGLIYWFAI